METATTKTVPGSETDTGPGVPEALPRTLEAVGQRLGHGAIDRLWVFPPLIQGRKERGSGGRQLF